MCISVASPICQEGQPSRFLPFFFLDFSWFIPSFSQFLTFFSRCQGWHSAPVPPLATPLVTCMNYFADANSVTQGFQLSRIERESPAWTLFLPLSRQACKISRINEKYPAKHVKSPASVGGTLENNNLANFHRQEGIQPQKFIIIIYYQLRLKKDVKLSIL